MEAVCIMKAIKPERKPDPLGSGTDGGKLLGPVTEDVGRHEVFGVTESLRQGQHSSSYY